MQMSGMTFLHLVFVAFVAGVAVQPQRSLSSIVVYISPLGSPQNSGLSPNSPLQTLGEALGAIGNADQATVVVAPGRYTWQSQLSITAQSFLTVACNSTAPHACVFSTTTSSQAVCLSVNARGLTTGPPVVSVFNNIDVFGCNAFAKVVSDGIRAVLTVVNSTISATEIAFWADAQSQTSYPYSTGSVALTIDGVDVRAPEFVALTADNSATLFFNLYNVNLRASRFSSQQPLIQTQIDANAAAQVIVRNCALSHGVVNSFIDLSDTSHSTLHQISVSNVAVTSTALITLGPVTDMADFNVDSVVGAVGGAVLNHTSAGAACSCNRTSVTNANITAFVVDNGASLAIANAKFGGINTGDNSTGGAFECLAGQLSLDSVLIVNNTAQSGAAGFCGAKCSINEYAVVRRSNHEQSNVGDCQ